MEQISKTSLFQNSMDQIFIGEMSVGPVVGKFFAKRESYLLAMEQIKESVEFLGLFNKSRNTTFIAILKGQLEVDIVEREDCIFLSFWFKGRSDIAGFSGLTDTKGFGYERFLEKYKEKPGVLLSLVCSETNEETIVSGIKKVRLQTL